MTNNKEDFIYCSQRNCPHINCLRHNCNTPWNVLIKRDNFHPNKDWQCKGIVIETRWFNIKDFQIYLCGGMGKFGKEEFYKSNNWRLYCYEVLSEYKDGLYNLIIINPNNYFNFLQEVPQYKTEREVMELDLHKLRKSDLVIVNFNDPYSVGSMIELGVAYERNIPIIGLNEDYFELHPWQNELCNRIFDNIDELLDYVKDFYLN